MGRKTLTVLITALLLVLAVVLLTSEGGVSKVMEHIGSVISRLFA